MQEIAKNLYVETGYVAPNVGCLITSEGSVLVDSPFLPKEARHWKGQLDRLGGEAVYVINTHCHFDHMLGNCFLGGKTVAHRTARRGFQFYGKFENLKRDIAMFWPKLLEESEEEFREVRIVPPQIEFSRSLYLYLAGTEVQLEHVGGHSVDTIWVYLPTKKVLFAGDLLENGRHPGMTNVRFDILLKVLKQIEGMDVDVVVPGHGEVGNLEVARNQREYFEEMIAFTKNLLTEGLQNEDICGRVSEHMIEYLPPTLEEKEMVGDMVAAGAMNVLKQVTGGSL